MFSKLTLLGSGQPNYGTFGFSTEQKRPVSFSVRETSSKAADVFAKVKGFFVKAPEKAPLNPRG